MRKSLLKLLGVAAAFSLSTCVSAVGMGAINVVSALGQPLKADIELVAVNKAEKASMVARLASPDAYKGSGLEYPYGNKYTLQIESRANGEPYIQVNSAQAINDPYVRLLVELTWASGKLLREYTFLVDPLDYVAEPPMAVQTVAPTVQFVPLEPVVKPIEHAIAEAPVESKAVEARSVSARVADARSVGIITVQPGDTLNKIAMQQKPAEVSLERMLVALYRANAEEFEAKNMNRIQAGKILRMPAKAEMQNVTQSDAVKEIHAQVADWNAYRQKLAGAASAASKPQDAQQVATGKIVSSVADKAPVAKESAKEVLKLSKGEVPGGAAGKTGRKNAEQEDAIAKDKSLKEEQMRAALLEKNLKDMQRLAQLKSEAVALTQSPGLASAPWAASGVAAVPVATTAIAPASQVVAASAVKLAPVAKPNPVSQPSLVDQVMNEPFYLAGGVAVLLGLGGVGYMARRRRQSFADAGGGQGALTGRITMPVAPSPETGDFTTTAAAYTEATPPAEDVDPISEADLFLNFGRDAQAEEILKDALQNMPNDHRIHLKLLGIYANRKDVNAFSAIARKLQDSGDQEAWQQAQAMGRKLEPNNPMYGGTIEADKGATAVLNVASVLENAQAIQEALAPEVDFDLGGEEKIPDQAVAEAAQAKTMDFDVTSNTSASGLMDFDVSANYASLDAPIKMDFDVTSSSPSLPAAEEAKTELPGMDDLIFDITSSHPTLPEASKPSALIEPYAEPIPPAEDEGMEFTLDFPLEEVAEKAAVQPVAAGLADISLDMGDIATSPVQEIKDEHWHEVATKLDLAKAYQEMGDATGAREILDEVLREGDEGQIKTAQLMLDQLG